MEFGGVGLIIIIIISNLLDHKLIFTIKAIFITNMIEQTINIQHI